MPCINPIMMTSIKEMADVSMRLLRGAIPAAAVILATLSGHAAWSQTARTIKIVVPYPPGGGPDILARLLADQIGRARGPTMVIENRPGAGTGIATAAAARAPADGGTLLIADSNFVIIPHFRKLNYDPRTGFERCASS